VGQFDVAAALQTAEKPYKLVILSAAKDLAISLRVNSAKDLAFLKQTTYAILRRLRLLRMTGPGSFSAACSARHLPP
jgi:peroxiredoxin